MSFLCPSVLGRTWRPGLDELIHWLLSSPRNFWLISIQAAWLLIHINSNPTHLPAGKEQVSVLSKFLIQLLMKGKGPLCFQSYSASNLLQILMWNVSVILITWGSWTFPALQNDRIKMRVENWKLVRNPDTQIETNDKAAQGSGVDEQ